MPVKRRLPKGRPHRVTDQGVEAWRAGDEVELRRLLDLTPWDASPFPLELTTLGCDQRTQEEDAAMPYANRIWNESWPLAQELQRELLAICPPGRVGRHGRPWGPDDAS